MTPRIRHTESNHTPTPPTQADIDAARKRLDDACVLVATILDGGKRDPTWHETQELENAAIAWGRLKR